MIGTIDVEIMAANPSMPLYPVRAFKNSPSSIRLRNVPKKIGNWNITSVQIVAAYPDSSIKTTSCVLVGGVWVGTIEGCPISGRSENGFTVFASGIDENGNPVSNYVLGKGLIEILEGDGTITPDAPSYYVHLLDTEPTNPKEGDLWPNENGGFSIWQNGRVYGMAGDAMTIARDANDAAQSAIDMVNNINMLIPSQADVDNPLADKAFVNSSVQTATANFRGNWATWNDVPTNANDYPVDYAGNTTPTVNDYMVVQDVTVDGKEGTWRYKYSGTWATDGKTGWLPEYQVNETPMTAAQLAALNSNITAAKVAQYDDALTKFNYELHTVEPTNETFVLPECFPINYWFESESYTIPLSAASDIAIHDYGEEGLWLEDDYNFPRGGLLVFSCTSDGKYFEEDVVITDITFGDSHTPPTKNVTQVLGFSTNYNLQDRAINTISINASNSSTINLVFPTLIPNHARDFIIRAVASAGAYSTPPTLSASGVTLMNAEGEMPEIATDENAAKTTLVYFSEIAANTFLVKGEALEAIS